MPDYSELFPQPAQGGGLFASNVNDPRFAANMGLFSGMMAGNMPAGVQAYAEQMGPQGQLQRAQLADTLQQIRLRDLQAQQQQRTFDLQTPFLELAAARARAMSNPSGSAPTSPLPLSGGLPGGAPSAPGGSQPVGSAATAPASNPSAASGAARSTMFPGIPDELAISMIGTGGFSKIPETISKYNEPTEMMKTMRGAGIPEGSPLWNQTLQGSLAKSNYVAPVNARPGSILRDPFDPTRPVAFNPHIPDGSQPVFDPSGNVTSLQPIGNAEQALALRPRAEQTGKNQVTPSIVYGSDGRPQFSTVAQDVNRANPGAAGQVGRAAVNPMSAQPGDTDIGLALNEQLAASKARLAATKNPIEVQRALTDIKGVQQEMARQGVQARAPTDPFVPPTQDSAAPVAPAGGLTPVLPPGTAHAATLSQDELSKKGASLMSDNAQVNTVLSRLQNIKQLAPAAIAGAESGRRDFMNGLLSLGGITGAQDAKTASDLVDKNSAQIVSALRMGQGGGGTDALQTLLSSANPNRHMTKEAIQEAADQLIAQQQMIQSKAQALQPHFLGRDPVAYGQKEMQFDQAADPRIWQLQSMKPDEQAAFIKKMAPSVAADLLQKRQALKALGVF